MIKLFLLPIAVLIAGTAAAQYGDANHAANEGSIRAAQARELNSTLNQIRSNMNSKSTPAAVNGTINSSNQNEMIAQELRRIYGKQTAAEKKFADSMKAEEVKQQQRQAELEAETRRWEYNRTFGERNNYAEKFYKLHKPGSLLPLFDLFELGYLDYLDHYNKKWQGSRYRNVITAAYSSNYTPSKYIAAASYLSIDSALIYLRGCSSYTSFALKEIELLRNKFPESEARIDSAEIDIWPYYFGANRPYASLELENFAYAPCQYEMANNEEKRMALRRIYTLHQKYPNYTLKACGKARIGFNPFLLYATKYFFNSDEITFLLFKWVLYSPANHTAVTESDDEAQYYLPATYLEPLNLRSSSKIMSYIGNKALKDAADWLIKNRPDYLKKLTKEEWKEICRLQGLNAKYMAWAFRGDNYKKFKKNFSALHQLIKEEEKQPDYRE